MGDGREEMTLWLSGRWSTPETLMEDWIEWDKFLFF